MRKAILCGLDPIMLFRTYVPSLLLTPLVKQGDVVILMGAPDLRLSMLSPEIGNNL